jgi:hypothetical protein
VLPAEGPEVITPPAGGVQQGEADVVDGEGVLGRGADGLALVHEVAAPSRLGGPLGRHHTVGGGVPQEGAVTAPELDAGGEPSGGEVVAEDGLHPPHRLGRYDQGVHLVGGQEAVMGQRLEDVGGVGVEGGGGGCEGGGHTHAAQRITAGDT